MTPIVIDSSAIVAAVLEKGLSSKALRAITESSALIVSRLALVETGRALCRAHAEKRITAPGLVRAQIEVEELWSRCEIWELTRAVCKEAKEMAPHSALHTLDALHLATFFAVKRKLPLAKLLSLDARMLDAAGQLGIKLLAT
jgi:predicted nucleic acid-binding protein